MANLNSSHCRLLCQARHLSVKTFPPTTFKMSKFDTKVRVTFQHFHLRYVPPEPSVAWILKVPLCHDSAYDIMCVNLSQAFERVEMRFQLEHVSTSHGYVTNYNMAWSNCIEKIFLCVSVDLASVSTGAQFDFYDQHLLKWNPPAVDAAILNLCFLLVVPRIYRISAHLTSLWAHGGHLEQNSKT